MVVGSFTVFDVWLLNCEITTMKELGIETERKGREGVMNGKKNGNKFADLSIYQINM